jgi:hypothetical protein
MIAAARLGQHVASVGQLGEDVYGAFFRRVMQVPALRFCIWWLHFTCMLSTYVSHREDAAYCTNYCQALLLAVEHAPRQRWQPLTLCDCNT